MNSDFVRCLSFTVGSEGSAWSGDKEDGGNWTGGAVGAGKFIGSKYGISAYILRSWRAIKKLPFPTIFTMQNLTYDTAKTIALEDFWNPIKGDDLPSGLNLVVFDFGYNTSPLRSVKVLQSCLGVTPDGIIGPNTLKAITNANVGYDNINKECMSYLKRYPNPNHVQVLVAKVCSEQYIYYDSLGSKKYANGWLSRTLRRLDTALVMSEGL